MGRSMRLVATQPCRSFSNGSRLQAQGDNSTIDFAFLPSMRAPEEPENYRVPILPNDYSTKHNAAPAEDAEVMKPEISTMSADAVFLPLAEMTDSHAEDVDFHAMADKVAANVRNMPNMKEVPAEEQASIMKQLWNDMVDDFFKAKSKKSEP